MGSLRSSPAAGSPPPVIKLLFQLCILLSASEHASGKTMNDGTYGISNGDPTSSVEYDTTYSRPQTEYFDVYSPPISTTYGQVFWRMMDDVPLPPAIVERFDGKVMAVVGYEVDQVMRTHDDGGGEEDVPVPITWAYNHHYAAWISNKNKVRLVKQRRSSEDVLKGRMDHGSGEFWTAVPLADIEDTTAGVQENESPIPLSHFFSEANGGEMRLSYHGYPAGYAQLLDSPTTFHIQPMQIDTWNRESNTAAYKAGAPLPRSSAIPPDAGYSGLIECPCTDRLEKEWWRTYELCEDKSGSGKEGGIADAKECFEAARTVTHALHYTESIVNDAGIPAGCTITQRADGNIDIQWNTHDNDAAVASTNQDNMPIATSRMAEMNIKDDVVAFASAQVNVTVSLPDSDEDPQASDAVTMTIVGPAAKWFAVGFGADTMCLHPQADECPGGGPYAIVVNSNGQASVEERKLDFHGPGKVLSSSITVKTASITDANVTVVLSRAIQGVTHDHYTFDPSLKSLPIITARGCSSTFARHCGHAPSSLTFLPVDVPQTICIKGIAGTIGGNNFHKDCLPFPKSDLLVQKNPTCSIETYRGGLQCCRDGTPLLDIDQEVPWLNQPLEYHLKFRFYFEEYADKQAIADMYAPSHKSLVRLYWQTEASAGEYDIVQCKEGTPSSQCVQVITSRWQVKDMMQDCSIRKDASWCTGGGSTDPEQTKGIELIYAAPHCHAPSCISMDLYNADTGELLCHVAPTFGKSDNVHDERNFLALAPCIYGDNSEGLIGPSLLTLDTTLLSIKKNNSTMGHTGEMASWQMRGIVVLNEVGQEGTSSSALRGQVR